MKLEHKLIRFLENMGYKFDPGAPSHRAALAKTLAEVKKTK